jgi:hypothetical protein
MSDADLLSLIRQMRAEADLLRHVAREADMEVATMVAATQRKRERERLRREWHGSRSTERARELGEDRQVRV